MKSRWKCYLIFILTCTFFVNDVDIYLSLKFTCVCYSRTMCSCSLPTFQFNFWPLSIDISLIYFMNVSLSFAVCCNFFLDVYSIFHFVSGILYCFVLFIFSKDRTTLVFFIFIMLIPKIYSFLLFLGGEKKMNKSFINEDSRVANKHTKTSILQKI